MSLNLLPALSGTAPHSRPLAFLPPGGDAGSQDTGQAMPAGTGSAAWPPHEPTLSSTPSPQASQRAGVAAEGRRGRLMHAALLPGCPQRKNTREHVAPHNSPACCGKRDTRGAPTACRSASHLTSQPGQYTGTIRAQEGTALPCPPLPSSSPVQIRPWEVFRSLQHPSGRTEGLMD